MELYANNVFRLVFRTLRNHADAEDVVQLSFEVLWKNVAAIPIEKARSYLFTVATRRAIDQIRRQKKVTHVADFASSGQPEPLAPERADAHELHEQLHAALNTLPETQRACILLRDYEGYSYHEIGEMLTLSESQVKVYIFRGRQKLQELLRGIRF